MAKARALGARDCEFESRRPDQIDDEKERRIASSPRLDKIRKVSARHRAARAARARYAGSRAPRRPDKIVNTKKVA